MSTIEEPPFIMHDLSPSDAVPGTSRVDNTYEEIKDEMLGTLKIVWLNGSVAIDGVA